MISVRRLNLVAPNAQFPRADIVFLRNVLIYFNEATKTKILRRVHRAMRKDAILILGGGEPLINLDVPFQKVDHPDSNYYVPST